MSERKRAAGAPLANGGTGEYAEIYLSGQREARWDSCAAGGASTAALTDLGLDAWEARGDAATEFCLDVSRYARMLLAERGLVPFGRPPGRGRRAQVYLSGRKRARWHAAVAAGAEPVVLADLGMDAWDARRKGDPARDFCLQVGRDARMRAAELGVLPYPDPDAEHAQEQSYAAAGKPLRGTVAPLREGRKPLGVRFRPPEDA